MWELVWTLSTTALPMPPLETKGFGALTTHDEMMAYVAQLADQSPMVRLESARGLVSEEAAPGCHLADLLLEGTVYPVHRLLHSPPDPG
jgi:hypothetical protein